MTHTSSFDHNGTSWTLRSHSRSRCSDAWSLVQATLKHVILPFTTIWKTVDTIQECGNIDFEANNYAQRLCRWLDCAEDGAFDIACASWIRLQRWCPAVCRCFVICSLSCMSRRLRCSTRCMRSLDCSPVHADFTSNSCCLTIDRDSQACDNGESWWAWTM